VYGLLDGRDIVYSCRIFVRQLFVIRILVEVGKRIGKVEGPVVAGTRDEGGYIGKAMYGSI